MFRRSAAMAVLLVLVAAPALAQAPPPGLGWLRGTVAKLDGDTLTINAADGMAMPVALTQTTRVQSLVKKSLADIKPGDFLASAGVKGTDGKIHAVEVRIFPQAMTNGGGQFDWDLGKGSVMTNALVGTVSKSPEGEVVHVTFKGGESEYSIGPEVPILAPAPGDRSLLKPGTAIIAFGQKTPDGGLKAAAIYVEKDGIKPPM
jgi:hypothetical protein